MKRLLLSSAFVWPLLTMPSSAETLIEVLAKAYENNQVLNASRAQLRATDENVPQARSGLRPQLSVSGSVTAARSGTTQGDGLSGSSGRTGSLGAGIQIDQTIFDGFRTPNNVRSAQAQVRASQANLENTVQSTMLDTVTVYMDVLRDREIARLRQGNIAFLEEQVRASNARFRAGEQTRTDVAQVDAELALGTATLNSAVAQVADSEASFFDIVGDVAEDLEPGTLPPVSLLPGSIAAALAASQQDHPAIAARLFSVEAAAYDIKSSQGALLPSVTVSGALDTDYSLSRTSSSASSTSTDLPGVDPNVSTQNQISTSIAAQVEIPIYQGGLASSQVRQAKEVLSQRRVEVDDLRDEVRTTVSQSWAQLQAAQANLIGYGAQVSAAQRALDGVVEERAVGQRTTEDVLEAQADLISAQVLLAGARRDVVVSAYTVVYSVGGLSVTRLALDVDVYDPNDHYLAVHDRWYGLRTPDGR